MSRTPNGSRSGSSQDFSARGSRWDSAPRRLPSSRERSVPDPGDKITIESITTPGRTQRVDRGKYMAMRDALIAVLPKRAPGMTVADAKAALLRRLPDDLFPGGATAGWWLK